MPRPGIVSKAEIKRCCRNLLIGLERRGIERMADLENWMGLSLPVPRTTHRVETRKVENSVGINYRISYVIPGKGFPLEIELSPTNDYTAIRVKGNFHPERYTNHRLDARGNPISEVFVEKCSVEMMSVELGYLVSSQ